MIRKLFSVCRCHRIRLNSFLAQVRLQQVVIRAFFQKIARTFIFSSRHTSTKRYLVFSLIHNKTAIIQRHVCQILIHNADLYRNYTLSNIAGRRKMANFGYRRNLRWLSMKTEQRVQRLTRRTDMGFSCSFQ